MNSLKRIFVLAGLAMFFLTSLSAQEDVTQFLDAGIQDAGVLSKEYLQPYGEMLGGSLKGGWYNSASVHKLGGFDITLTVSASMVPSSGKTFDVNKALEEMSGQWKLGSGSPNISPTIAGEQEARPFLVETDGSESTRINLPDGTGFGMLPVPAIQAAVGLPYNSDVTLRFIPTISLGNAGKVNLWGLGLRHSLNDYVPFIRNSSIFNASVMLGYTKFGSDINIDDEDSFVVGSKQKLNINAGSLMTRVLFGINIPVLSVYTGLGYSSSGSDFDLKGDYLIEETIMKDPLSLDYSSKGIDFNIGLRLRFGFIAIHGDYTVGDYSMLTAGFGVNIR